MSNDCGHRWHGICQWTHSTAHLCDKAAFHAGAHHCDCGANTPAAVSTSTESENNDD